MKKYIVLMIAALFFASCENTEYNRGNVTMRGNDIYLTWKREMCKMDEIVNDYTFALNEIVNAKSVSEADSVYKCRFSSKGGRIITHEERVYQIVYCSYYAESSFLVMTDGNDLTMPGTTWTLVLNLPHDFVYNKTGEVYGKMYREPMVMDPNVCAVAYGKQYLPLTVTCREKDKWVWKDLNADGETIKYFSVDWTVSKTKHEVVPGVVVDVRYDYNGRGQFLVDGNGHYVRYEMMNLVSEAKIGGNYIGGSAEIVAKDESSGAEVPVSLDFNPTKYTVTYRGISEDYPIY